eukprot:6415489-Amphidinium_carterae.2
MLETVPQTSCREVSLSIEKTKLDIVCLRDPNLDQSLGEEDTFDMEDVEELTKKQHLAQIQAKLLSGDNNAFPDVGVGLQVICVARGKNILRYLVSSTCLEPHLRFPRSLVKFAVKLQTKINDP